MKVSCPKLDNDQSTFVKTTTTTTTTTTIIIIIIINVIKKEAEKILKYKELTIEIQRMWNANDMKSRNSRKQPYWALHTYFGKY